MGWKGTLRSLEAAQRASEREARRREREHDRATKEATRQAELEQASFEVEVYETYISDLVSLHAEPLEDWDWRAISAQLEPEIPVRVSINESDAQAASDRYVPGLVDRVLRRGEKRRAQLHSLIGSGRAEDDRAFVQATRDAEQELEDWRDMQRLADGVSNADPSAYQEVLEGTDVFEEFGRFCTEWDIEATRQDAIRFRVGIPGDEHVPNEAKSLLQSGRLSTKKIPKSKRNELYQDHVCSLMLRAASDCLALVPVDFAFVDVRTPHLNSQTGHLEDAVILSVAVSRKTFASLNLRLIDPSDAMSNFVHEMDFKKSSGFKAIEPLPSDAV